MQGILGTYRAFRVCGVERLGFRAEGLGALGLRFRGLGLGRGLGF